MIRDFKGCRTIANDDIESNKQYLALSRSARLSSVILSCASLQQPQADQAFGGRNDGFLP